MKQYLSAEFVWRSKEPAKSPPNEEFPFGMAVDLSAGRLPACKRLLPYPAPGVGSWLVKCSRCGIDVLVTAAGRADDPTQVLIACKATASAPA